MKYSKLVLFLSLLISFTSCEKYEFDDCPQPPNTVTVDTSNISIVTDDYPNLSGKWLLYEVYDIHTRKVWLLMTPTR